MHGPHDTSHEPPEAEGRASASATGGSALVFWLLMAMAVASFAPCVIMPEWRQYQVLHAAEQVQQARVDRLEQAVTEEQRKLDAMRTDPAAVARLAQRELRYRPAGEEVVWVPTPVTAPPGDKPIVVQPPALPGAVAQAAGYLPTLNYDGIFCEAPTRYVIMSMSVALAVVATALFRPRRGDVAG
ncbi:MAG TPA: hypothetical protein PKK06_11750 [Phycisphaerae bacterium]|nr:hypothetical protein [Phycisphaerae bacterium]HNU45865.1 hypothetical protein [Phycisphaerae bacterium]